MRGVSTICAAAVLALAGCRVGPNYKTPPAPVAPAFRETPPASFQEWKPAHPNESAIRGKWWEIYNDPALNWLEEQVNISNQNVLAAEASYREAVGAIKVARSGLFPAVGVSPGMSLAHGTCRC